ncbi:nucleoside-diphosphate-sugar epimerase [Plasticicumulans lactativorans]|uniref:Nucleoside-diphosphate-sugar epimerase n=1 Tax=Plasticicumulans lactativorans TaxID=1133106 RepID=A0A4R2L1L1_9GAMM|nr:SDR family oxidoreductase [Plasticicumulans lactativorans]TCO80334.1 nucleoside-diphosphate-sugar epimerase [Plasticicumulans lactativorans]
MNVVLVTGATGFIGSEVCRQLLDRGWRVRAALRRAFALPTGVESAVVGDIGADTDWSAALDGVGAVIHLAARVHVMHEQASDPLNEFRRVNVAGTSRLATQAAAAGVGRLVFVSSIKVNGESTDERPPFTETDPAAPVDPYGISKWEAETELLRISAASHLEVAIVRPPLVYGPGVGGNLRRILRAVASGLPLPFASIDNRRSLIGVWNLADLLLCALTHPRAAGEIFLAADGRDLSTPALIRGLAAGMGRPARLFPVPQGLLTALGRWSGRGAEMNRLCGSLEVDAGKARTLLGWEPPVAVEDGLRRTAQAILGNGGG